MKKDLFCFLILVSVCSSQIFAQCQSNFSWAQSANNVITFTDLSSNVPANTNYMWNFGDNQGSTLQNPVHTYNVPGTYNVCLLISDSMAGNCNSTFCANITVTGVVICNITLYMTSTMASCSTCTDGVAHAYPSGGTAPYTYLWQPGNITTPSVTGMPPGTYTCCVTDANACTACNSATITGSVCQANFTWTQTANNIISFTNTSTGTSASTSYSWNFGDANSSWSVNPVHTYTTPGTYNVCLHIDDSLAGSCNSTFCSSVTVTGVNCSTLTLSVTSVNATCGTCNDGSASANATGGTPPYSYLWNTGDTSQTINNLVSGIYSCCITDALGCTACSNSIVYGCNAFYTLTPDITPHTYNAVSTVTGTPPINYVWSWGDSTFSYTALPSHTYAASGFYVICLTISDTSGCQSTYCDSSYLARLDNPLTMITVHVVSELPSGVDNTGSENSWSLFPNPFSEQTILSFSQELQSATFRVYDLYGRLMQEKNNINGKEIILSRENLSSGIYIYEVTDKEKKICTGKAVVY